MKIIASILTIIIICAGCNKDKFTTIPQVKFIKFSPDTVKGTPISTKIFSIMSFEITDKEGDFGDYSSGSGNFSKKTSFIYLKRTKPTLPFQTSFDSLPFPASINGNAKNKVPFEVSFDIIKLSGKQIFYPNRFGINRDTIEFDVYVKDTSGNVSTIIKSGPFYWTK